MPELTILQIFNRQVLALWVREIEAEMRLLGKVLVVG